MYTKQLSDNEALATPAEVYILPTYWAPCLINDDCSDLEPEEMKEIDDWIAKHKPGYCVGVSEDHWFAHRNDANNLGNDVSEFTFISEDN